MVIMRHWRSILVFACSMFCIHSMPVPQEMPPVKSSNVTSLENNCWAFSSSSTHEKSSNSTHFSNTSCKSEANNTTKCCSVSSNSTFATSFSELMTISEASTEPQSVSLSPKRRGTGTGVKQDQVPAKTLVTAKPVLATARLFGANNFPRDCGRTSVTFQRIVGGQEATLGAWPWMAIMFIIRRGRRSAECGGALVTDSHVITAAHCVVTSRRGNTINPRNLLVRLGEHDIENDNDGAKHVDVAVRFIIRHEQFNLRTFQNDIAILVLSSSVRFTRQISPICLPFNHFAGDALEQRNAMTAGWGTLSFGGPQSTKLMEVQLRIWQNLACRRIFRNDVPITNVNLCAGDGDKDACSGDSGGPLMLTDEENRFYLIGIVSFGKKCGEPGIPGVYVRVSTFLDWIEQKIE